MQSQLDLSDLEGAKSLIIELARVNGDEAGVSLSSKIDWLNEQEHIDLYDVLYVLRNCIKVEPVPGENCFIVTGLTLDDFPLQLSVCISLEAKRVNVLSIIWRP